MSSVKEKLSQARARVEAERLRIEEAAKKRELERKRKEDDCKETILRSEEVKHMRQVAKGKDVEELLRAVYDQYKETWTYKGLFFDRKITPPRFAVIKEEQWVNGFSGIELHLILTVDLEKGVDGKSYSSFHLLFKAFLKGDGSVGVVYGFPGQEYVGEGVEMSSRDTYFFWASFEDMADAIIPNIINKKKISRGRFQN